MELDFSNTTPREKSGSAGEVCGSPAVQATFLSVVVPVYKEEGNIPEFVNRISAILNSITPRYEIIFCLDPSPDRTEALILDARKRDQRIKLLKFSRRFGQPFATLAGLQ